MLLNLSKIIEAPGEIPFEAGFDMGEYSFDSILSFEEPLHMKGRVRNSAGVLTLDADMNTSLLCRCDRCGEQYLRQTALKAEAVLGDNLQDSENPDIFQLKDDCVDLKELAATIFILELDSKFLCRDNCRGVCFICGANLNDGSCICEKETDPRLAALADFFTDET